MPPRKTFVFKNKFTDNATISIETYGDKYTAWGLLECHVSYPNDWELI